MALLDGLRDFVPQCARTIAEAVDAARNARFDLYVVDSRLPEEDGLEFCRRIREFDRETPIVFYGPSSGKADEDRPEDAGAKAQEPLSPEELEETLRRLLSPELHPKTGR